MTILFISKAMTETMGVQGLLLTAGIAGLGDASALTISAARLTETSAIGMEQAVWAIWLAIAANALAKWILAVTRGGKPLAFWLVGGFLTMLGVGIGLTLLLI